MSKLIMARLRRGVFENMSPDKQATARDTARRLFGYDEEKNDGTVIPHDPQAGLQFEHFGSMPLVGSYTEGIGWFVIVSEHDANTMLFKEMMWPDGPLSAMYEIDVYQLNDDQTTRDVYRHMTPAQWGAGGRSGT